MIKVMIGYGIHPILKREAKSWLLSQGCKATYEEVPISGAGVDFLNGETRNFRIDIVGFMGNDHLLGVECGKVNSFILPVYYHYGFIHEPIELYHLPNVMVKVGQPHLFGSCIDCSARGYWRKLAEMALTWYYKTELPLPDI